MKAPSGRWVLLICLYLLASHARLLAADLQAGAAKIDITPPTGYAMWGYGARHDAPSEDVLDPLHARVLLLAVGEEKIAIVSLDLGRAPTRDSTAAVREKVKKAG